MDLPNGYQSVYVGYPGDGSQLYFTAPSDYEARKFIEGAHPQVKSVFKTFMILTAKGSWIFRNGIMQVTGNINILED